MPKKSHFSISKSLEHCFFDCRNRKIPLELKVRNRQKRGKTRVSKSRLVLVSHLIGLGNGARFLDQSQSEVKRCQSNTKLLLTRKWKWLYQVTEFFLSCFSNCRSHWTASEHGRWSYELPGFRISWAASGHHEYEWTLQPITYDFHSLCW